MNIQSTELSRAMADARDVVGRAEQQGIDVQEQAIVVPFLRELANNNIIDVLVILCVFVVLGFVPMEQVEALDVSGIPAMVEEGFIQTPGIGEITPRTGGVINIRESASTQTPVVFEINKRTNVEVLERTEIPDSLGFFWYRVQFQTEGGEIVSGWIRQDLIVGITPVPGTIPAPGTEAPATQDAETRSPAGMSDPSREAQQNTGTEPAQEDTREHVTPTPPPIFQIPVQETPQVFSRYTVDKRMIAADTIVGYYLDREMGMQETIDYLERISQIPALDILDTHGLQNLALVTENRSTYNKKHFVPLCQGYLTYVGIEKLTVEEQKEDLFEVWCPGPEGESLTNVYAHSWLSDLGIIEVTDIDEYLRTGNEDLIINVHHDWERTREILRDPRSIGMRIGVQEIDTYGDIVFDEDESDLQELYDNTMYALADLRSFNPNFFENWDPQDHQRLFVGEELGGNIFDMGADSHYLVMDTSDYNR